MKNIWWITDKILFDDIWNFFLYILFWKASKVQQIKKIEGVKWLIDTGESTGEFCKAQEIESYRTIWTRSNIAKLRIPRREIEHIIEIYLSISARAISAFNRDV